MIPLNLCIAAVLAALLMGAGGGWTANGWKLGKDLATAQGRIHSLTLVNDQCAADVRGVKTAVKDIAQQSDLIAKNAKAEMAKAAGAAKGHLAKAESILASAPAPPDKWCETIASEQRAYIEGRQAK